MARPLNADVVFDAVCEWFRVNGGDVIGTGTSPRLVQPRRFIARILRDDGWSLSEIGREIHRNHSSVFNLLRTELPGGDWTAVQKFVKEKCDAEPV